MNQKAHTAKLFGEYLDDDNFPAVKTILDDNCIYEINDQLLKGKDDIVDLYQTNMEEGKQKFDHLEWGKSFITEVSEHEFEVHFSDFLQHQGISHNYKCKQLLTVNEQFLIEKITHIEIAKEKEALLAFYKQVGLDKQ